MSAPLIQNNAASASTSGFVVLAPSAAQNITGAFPLALTDKSSQIGIGATPASGNGYLYIVMDAATSNGEGIELHTTFAQGASFYTHSDTGFRAPTITLFRSRGTQASPTAVLAGQALGYAASVFGYAGTNGYQVGGNITLSTTENWSNTANGTQMVFGITPVGSTGTSTALTLTSAAAIFAGSIQSGTVIQVGSTDTSFSRQAAGVIKLGNGSAGDFTGTLNCTQIYVGTGAYVAAQPGALFIRQNGGVAFNLSNFVDADLQLSFTASGVGTKFALIAPSTDITLRLGQNGTARWDIITGGHLIAHVDNTYDIGASGATRPRNVYVGTALTTPSAIISTSSSPTSAGTAGTTGQITWDSGKFYVCTAGGVAGSATWKATTLTSV